MSAGSGLYARLPADPTPDGQPGPTHRAYALLQAAMATEGGTWTTDRALQLFTTAGIDIDRNSAWGLVRHLTLNPPTAATTWQQGALFT